MTPAAFVALAEALAEFRDSRPYAFARREASAGLVAAFSAPGVRSTFSAPGVRSAFCEGADTFIPRGVRLAVNLCASTAEFFDVVPEATSTHFRRAHEELIIVAAEAIHDWLYPPEPATAEDDAATRGGEPAEVPT